jgi:nicotinamide-nucleotide amidase
MNTKETDEVEELAALLIEKGLTLAVAESCTGGLLGSMVTSLAGSSAYFKGGIISYADSIKFTLLGVDSETIESFGAVSKECAELMAKGAREKLSSDIGVSITGVAGPEGGTNEKPVGTVFISVSSATESVTEKLILSGSRSEIREESASMAIRLIIKVLRSERS